MNSGQSNSKIILWLWIGFVMIFIQILLGGITRLTGSGLSITRWDIVTGILYPINDETWNYHFELYKQTPQFQKINQGMSLEQFKFIFFWEYIHRLWARLMGFVFIIPFSFFLIKKWIDKKLLFRLMIVILLAILVASLGWIMVASGLTERPWVNAYKLSFHLITAVGLLSFLFYTILNTQNYWPIVKKSGRLKIMFIFLIAIIVIQIFSGGVMAGMKAGLSAPTWPKIQGRWIPEPMYHLSSLSNYLFTEYEISHTGPVVVQFFHRSLSYLIFLITIVLYYSIYKQTRKWNLKYAGLFFICLVQMFLGIWTVIHCIGYVPLWPAVFHQLFGISILIYTLWLYCTPINSAESSDDNRRRTFV
jgi:cytochrome c oxidase assembly protein subunit 15